MGWLFSLFKKPDIATAVIVLSGIIIALIKFLWWVVKENKKIQSEHNEMITNHIVHNTSILDQCSKSMGGLSGEHDRMIEHLIKLNERVRK